MLFDEPQPKQPPSLRSLAIALAFWCIVGAVAYFRQPQTWIGRAARLFSVGVDLLMVVAAVRVLVLRFRSEW